MHGLSIDRSWQQYVATQCIEACGLDVETTRQVLTKIDALVTARVLTMPAVALVLCRAGVAESAADRLAPGILAAIGG